MPPRVICQMQPFALSTERAFQTALCRGIYAHGRHMNSMAADLSRRAMCQPTCHTRPDLVTLPKLHTLPLMPLKQLSQCWSMHKCHHAHSNATNDLPWVCPACMPRSFPQRASIQAIPLVHPPPLHHATQPLPVAVHQLAPYANPKGCKQLLRQADGTSVCCQALSVCTKASNTLRNWIMSCVCHARSRSAGRCQLC
jgi:hypothetical protein